MSLLIGFILGFLSVIALSVMVTKRKAKKGEFASAYYDDANGEWIVRGNLYTITGIIERIDNGTFRGKVTRKS